MRLIVGHRQGDAVGSGGGVTVASRLAGAGRPITKVPTVTGDATIAVAGGAGIKAGDQVRLAVGKGCGRRHIGCHHAHAGALTGGCALIVGHRQGDGVGSGGGVTVASRLAAAGRAITKAPAVTGNAAIAVAG